MLRLDRGFVAGDSARGLGTGTSRAGAPGVRGRAALGRALLAAVVGAAPSFAACSGAQSSQAPAEAATAPESGAGEAAAEGAGESTPVAAPHGKRAPCSSDQSCNDDPAVSALWGRCTEMGVCECNEGFERSPTSDLCRPVE